MVWLADGNPRDLGSVGAAGRMEVLAFCGGGVQVLRHEF
jgi:hypothetical protein